jgi:hypothetical protein
MNDSDGLEIKAKEKLMNSIQWLRRYVTNLKVAGSRPDEVNDFYQVT